MDDGEILLEKSEVRAYWAGYFEQLYQADDPNCDSDDGGAVTLIADTPIDPIPALPKCEPR